MTQQSPTISIPKKATEEVDWTTPIRNLVAQSYGESPDNYATECAALQRCRQDAVRGAGSDMTARDLLFKYFGQLELLELRFAEIRVTFPWHDAFTNKLTTQTSLAFEKASIIFQMAATHSSIAAAQSRADPEGLKRAFHYFRTSAGMLSYINENFLHAPSTDLSREVVKFLVDIVLAQATEVFYEKCVFEKKSSGLVTKVANQAATMYTGLCDEVKEFMGKGLFDRNWVTIVQIKAKYFTSLTHLHRAEAETASGKYGEALSRLMAAETHAKEAAKSAAAFGGMFMPQMSPNLPPDAGSSIQELTKVHSTLCTEKRKEAENDNDMIYHALIPNVDTLPRIDKITVATPITIQEVYTAPDVQKTIGPDLFIKLVPLSVHESASVYSEEKAKLVRAEVERTDTADGEVRSALDAMGVKEGLGRYKLMVEGLHAEGTSELPADLSRMREDIAIVEEQEPVTRLMAELVRLRDAVRAELDGTKQDLDSETRDCEANRVKYEHKWTQTPSAGLTRSFRQDQKSHMSALDAASASDKQVVNLWDAVKGDIALLLSPQVEDIFRQSADQGPGGSLLDLDPANETRDDEERAKIMKFVDEIEDRLGRLNKIAQERKNVLKDLKEKIQTDDVSHLLLLNRRNSSVEPTLFAAELEKFKPFQTRLTSTVQHEQIALQELTKLWKGLKDFAGRGPGAKKWEEREKRKKDTMRRFSRARDGYMEVRDGLAKGLQFYHDLTDLSTTLRRSVKSFISERTSESEAIISRVETEKRQATISSPPPLAERPRVPMSPPSSLDSSFSSMNLRNGSPSGPSPPQAPVRQSAYSLPPPPPAPSSFSPPPIPSKPPSVDPYANMFTSASTPSHFKLPSSPPPPPSQQSTSYGQPNYGRPPSQYQSLSSLSPPPQPPQQYSSQSNAYAQPSQYSSYGAQPQQSQNAFPPPPAPFPPPSAPVSYQSQYSAPPPAPGAYGGFPPPPPPPGQSPGNAPNYGQYSQSSGYPSYAR